MRCCSCFVCLSSGGVLLGLLLFPKVLSQNRLQLLLLHGVLTLESRRVERLVASNDCSAAGLHNHGGLELSHELTSLLSEHWVRHEQVVVEALAHTNLCGGLVLDRSDREGHRRESFVDLDKEGACALHLQVVDLVELALEHSAAGLVLLGLTLAGGDVHVELEDIAGSELVLLHGLSADGPVDDDLVAVNGVLFDLVGEDTLHGVALELLGNSLNNISHIRVGGTNTDLAHASLERVLSGEDHISLAASDGTITDDSGSGSVGSVAVEVSTANAASKKLIRQPKVSL